MQGFLLVDASLVSQMDLRCAQEGVNARFCGIANPFPARSNVAIHRPRQATNDGAMFCSHFLCNALDRR